MTETTSRMQDAGRKQRQLVGFAVKDDRVAGVVAPLIADDDVMFVGEQIDDFSLGLVSPLQADNRRGRHGQKLRNYFRFVKCGWRANE